MYGGAEPIPEGQAGLFCLRLLKYLYPTIIYTKRTYYGFWNFTVEKCDFDQCCPLRGTPTIRAKLFVESFSLKEISALPLIFL